MSPGLCLLVESSGRTASVPDQSIRLSISLGLFRGTTRHAPTAKLQRLGPVDVLCTHVAPAVRPLSTDVIGGRAKESAAVLDYVEAHRPPWHYFGDIHQPQAVSWRVGATLCRNVGYFRATRRPVRHG